MTEMNFRNPKWHQWVLRWKIRVYLHRNFRVVIIDMPWNRPIAIARVYRDIDPFFDRRFMAVACTLAQWSVEGIWHG